MHIRGFRYIAVGLCAGGGLVMLAAVLAIVAKQSPVGAALIGLGFVCCAAGAVLGSLAVARRVRRWARSIGKSARNVPSAKGGHQEPGYPPRLLLAIDVADSADELLEAVGGDAAGTTIVVTDSADLVARCSGVVAVEYLPEPLVHGDPRDQFGLRAVRLAELVVEHGAQEIVLWSDGEMTTRWKLPAVSNSAGASVPAAVVAAHEARRQAVESKRQSAQLQALRTTIEKRFDRQQRQTRRDIDDVYGQLESLDSLYRLLDPPSPFPPLRRWALSPDLALHLVRLVLSGDVRTALETGSGSSTILLATAFEKVGEGRVVALEHDSAYAAATRREIAARGLEHRATVLDAPLAEMTFDQETYLWYDVQQADLPREVDLLFVDGPPQATGAHARYPALPALRGAFSATATVVLDDGNRPEEQEIVRRWSELPGVISVRTLAVERSAAELQVVGSPGEQTPPAPSRRDQ